MTGVLISGKFGQRHRDNPSDGGGRGGRDTATSQEHQSLLASPQQLGGRRKEEGGRSLPYRFQRKHGSADTLILDFWPPGTMKQ